MDTQTIRCAVQDYIALVTMDRPPVNAVNAQFLDDMMLVFDTLSDRDDVRVKMFQSCGSAPLSASGRTSNAREGQR